MVLNPPLLLVSALFFLTLVSVFYLVSWLAASVLLRSGRGRLSPATAKRVLMAALVLPPLLAAVPTLGGATLRHSHASPALEHHSNTCREMLGSLFAQGSAFGLSAGVSETLGGLANGLAWLLVGAGLLLLLRLVQASVNLERGLTPYLDAPSPRLRQSLARVRRQLPGLTVERFHECAIPAAYSSVLGLRRVRCVLSREFVAAATEEELDAVVAHEASHMQGGDVWATLIVGVLNCLFFALRPVRLLARRWHEAAELACDDAAVAATRQPLAMAAAILRAGGSPVSSHRAHSLPSVVMPFADETACAPEKRIERLLAHAQQAALPAVRESTVQVWGGWLVTAALAGLGAIVLHSTQIACFAHCSLEAVARLLP